MLPPNLGARQERPLIKGAARHPSVKQFMNRTEACTHRSISQVTWSEPGPTCIASFLVNGRGAVPSLHSLRPAVIQAKALSLSMMRPKKEAKSAQCGAATACRLERRSRHGRLSWTLHLVRADNDRHAGCQGLLRQSLGLGHSGRFDAGSGLHFVYRCRSLGKRAHGSARGRKENGGDAEVDGLCR